MSVDVDIVALFLVLISGILWIVRRLDKLDYRLTRNCEITNQIAERNKIVVNKRYKEEVKREAQEYAHKHFK